MLFLLLVFLSLPLKYLPYLHHKHLCGPSVLQTVRYADFVRLMIVSYQKSTNSHRTLFKQNCSLCEIATINRPFHVCFSLYSNTSLFLVSCHLLDFPSSWFLIGSREIKKSKTKSFLFEIWIDFFKIYKVNIVELYSM